MIKMLILAGWHGLSARVEYEDNEAKIIGYVNTRAPTMTAFTSAVTAVLADIDLTTAMRRLAMGRSR
jgi:hypothetical protein